MGSGRRDEVVILTLIFAGALIPLLTTPVIPAIDLYNHVSRYFVMAHTGSDGYLAGNYQNHWALLPNIGLDVISVPLARRVPPLLLAKGIVVLIFAVQFSGALALSSALRPGGAVFCGVLAAPLLYNFILTWGFANFLFGLGLLLWASAWWVRTRGRTVRAVAVSCLLAVLVFLAHGFVFALYGVVIAVLELSAFVRSGERSVRRAARLAAPVALQAVVPAALFLMSSTAQTAGGVTNAVSAVAQLSQAGGLLARLADLFIYRMTTFVRVEHGPALVFDGLTFVVQGLLLAYGWSRGVVRVSAQMAASLAVGCLLAVVTPPTLFGIGHISDRIPVFVAFLFIASLELKGLRWETAGFMAAFAVIASLRLGATALDWSGYAREFEDFQRIADNTPSHVLVANLVIGGSRPDDDHRRCEMYTPLLAGARDDAVGLFASNAAQPFRLIGPLRAATDRLPPQRSWGEPLGNYPALALGAVAAGFDEVLVCNPTGQRFTPPHGLVVAASAGRFMLLKADAPLRRDAGP